MSSDILENRILKYTLFYLSHCYFAQESINAQLLRFYKRLDEVSLVPIATEDFMLVEFTPLNQHYRTILRLCELLLRDSALDESIGERTGFSFLIDMNRLFEEFIGNLLTENLQTYEVELQKIEYPERTKKLKIKMDIVISLNRLPLFIIDTKYQDFSGRAKVDHLGQLSLYSNTIHVKNCALVYVGKSKVPPYDLEENVRIYVVNFDLKAQNEGEFKQKCELITNEISGILIAKS